MLGRYGRAIHALQDNGRPICTNQSEAFSAQNEVITRRLGRGEPTCGNCLYYIRKGNA
jgi:hypothetical protein